MDFKLLSSRGPLYQGKVAQVILPAKDGEISVLDFHQPFLCRLDKGQVKIKESAGSLAARKLSFSVSKGLAKMQANRLIVLAQQ